MRIISGFLIVAAASFGLAPSSPELHNRYGLSDLERFTVRPGITATVQYGADHLACQIKIEPYKSIVGQDVVPPPRISSQEMSEVLDELVPRAARGKEISNSSFQSSACGVGNVNEFENVVIFRALSPCGPPNVLGDTATQIVLKRDVCPKVTGMPHFEPLPSGH
jgi:hypothetical protein